MGSLHAARRRRPRAWVAIVAVILSLVGAGCAATDPPAAGEARTIGVLRTVASPQTDNVETLLTTLAEGGWVAGENLTVLGRDPSEVHAEPADAQAVVTSWRALGLDLVVALSSTSAQAAAAAAPDTPVLFLSNDPTGVGLVANERRPAGTLTGVTYRVPADRTIDLARQVVPDLHRIGFLSPADDPVAAPSLATTAEAAAELGMDLLPAAFQDTADIPAELHRLRDEGAGALLLANAPGTVRAFPAIAEAAAAAGLPVVANTAADFAVVVLEPDAAELYRQLGRQAVRLLSGTPVADVPVEDPAGYRLTLNAGVAARLGIEFAPEVKQVAHTVVP